MLLSSRDAEAAQDLALLSATHAHTLIVGPAGAVDAVIATVESGLRKPVVDWTPALSPNPPMLAAGTLIVRNVAGLEHDQQRQLLDWVNTGRDVQVISTSGGHMWPLVERGAFLPPLYYRLGVVCVDLTGAAHA